MILTKPQGFVRDGGFPFEPGRELTLAVVSEIITKYPN